MILKTTDTQFHGLETAVETARANSATVRVAREALRNLIADHYTLNLAVKRKHGELPETKP